MRDLLKFVLPVMEFALFVLDLVLINVPLVLMGTLLMGLLVTYAMINALPVLLLMTHA